MRRYLLMLLLIPSIALLFLPYAEGVSPWQTVSNSEGWRLDGCLALLGAPFFLSIAVAIVHLLVKKRLPKGQRIACRILACVGLGAGLAVFGLSFWHNGFDRRDVPMLFTWGTFCAAVVWIMARSIRRLSPAASALVALQAAWLPNALLCAIAFQEHWQIGAYLAIFTIGVYSVEIAAAMLRNGHLSETGSRHGRWAVKLARGDYEVDEEPRRVVVPVVGDPDAGGRSRRGLAEAGTSGQVTAGEGVPS